MLILVYSNNRVIFLPFSFHLSHFPSILFLVSKRNIQFERCCNHVFMLILASGLLGMYRFQFNQNVCFLKRCVLYFLFLYFPALLTWNKDDRYV